MSIKPTSAKHAAANLGQSFKEQIKHFGHKIPLLPLLDEICLNIIVTESNSLWCYKTSSSRLLYVDCTKVSHFMGTNWREYDIHNFTHRYTLRKCIKPTRSVCMVVLTQSYNYSTIVRQLSDKPLTISSYRATAVYRRFLNSKNKSFTINLLNLQIHGYYKPTVSSIIRKQVKVFFPGLCAEPVSPILQEF